MDGRRWRKTPLGRNGSPRSWGTDRYLLPPTGQAARTDEPTRQGSRGRSPIPRPRVSRTLLALPLEQLVDHVEGEPAGGRDRDNEQTRIEDLKHGSNLLPWARSALSASGGFP